MNAFDFAAPTDVVDALKLMRVQNAAGLSGGTDLLGRMKDYVSSPQRIVYLKDIKDLAGISGDSASGPTLGAGTTLAAILGSQAIREGYPALWQSTLEVGTPQIRNMATVGGNLLQRPRCWYFRTGNGLLAMKDGKSLVRAGDNRYHAIFMTDGDALFVNPSSLAAPLIALGATATITGPRGDRTVPVESLYQVPKTDKDSELTVAPGELLVKVMIPPAKGKNASYEVRQKQAHDWPLVLAAVNLAMDGDKVSAAKVVIYGVAPIPWKSEAAEKSIVGKAVTIDTATAAGNSAIENVKPLSMNGYKVGLTKTAVKRALLAAVGNRYWEG
jgi:xanthine dehydrogenase YagS FAD-binding subunit